MNALETRINALLELFEQKELSEEFDQKFCQTLTEIFNAEQASILAVIEILNKRGRPFNDTDKAWARTFAALYAMHLQTTVEMGREQSAFPEYVTSTEEPTLICASCSMELILRLVIKAACSFFRDMSLKHRIFRWKKSCVLIGESAGFESMISCLNFTK
jgi:hypothetical protein